MQTTVYTTPAGFDLLEKEWNDLLARSSTDVPFLRWEWQKTWWTHLGEGELFLIAVRAADGQLVGLAPLFRLDEITHTSLCVVGCVDVSDYLDIIVARGQETPVYAALLDALAGPDAPSWSKWELCNIPEASPTLSVLSEAARAHGCTTAQSVQSVCPVIRLPDTWDDYLAGLSKKDRHELRRKIRRAQEAGKTTFSITHGEDLLDADLDDFIELLIQSSPDKADFMDKSMRAFFHAAGHAAQRAGWLQLAFMEVDGVRAAAYMNFDYNRHVMVYNSGLDTDRFGHLSPGVALAGWTIRHAIEQKRAVFDFLRGDEEYKYRLGATDTHIYRLSIQRA
jgi:CelD/BcsL family acetyltransferase involved in cellulose biosynthesis